MPTVLLLYSYDCSAHEKVVEALSGFLIETCNCNVHLDMFEEQMIHERGLDDWLIDRLQEAEFIIVISSIGARLRCSKKKVKFKLDPTKTLPDYFAVAVDYVAEKMRVERSKGMPLTTFCVAYMDYSTESDIPPQLEMAFKFCLMKDISALFCHLHGINGEPTKDGSPIVGLTPETYDTSEMGQELRVAIESAKAYFASNPDWVEDRIEPIPIPTKSKSRLCRKSSQEPLLLPTQIDTSVPPPGSHRIGSEILCHTGTKTSDHSQNLPLVPLQNRQGSFRSSLSSRQTLSTPPFQKNAKSCDNFAQESPNQCELCALEGHTLESSECKAKHMLSLPQDADADDTVKRKSKSMPAVNRNSLYSSQTIFKAEVHKEWDDQDSRLSQADSQETSSNHESLIDDLEKDLDSIMHPVHINSSHFAHTGYDNITGVYNVLSFPPVKMDNICEISKRRHHDRGDYHSTDRDLHRDAFCLLTPKLQSQDVDQIQLENL